MELNSLKYYLWNFFLPNIKLIQTGKLKYSKKLKAFQKLHVVGDGNVIIGKNCTFGCHLGGFYRWGCIEIQSRSNKALIKIGHNVKTNNNIFLCAFNKITIGCDTLIGQNVTILDHEGHNVDPKNRRSKNVDVGEVNIGKNAWIGNNVIILKNTSIGNNSIVAAGAVVTKKFSDNVIIGGVPAKIIKKI